MLTACAHLYFHAITSVKYRDALIDPVWEDQLYKIMGKNLVDMGHTPIIINGHYDHIHLFWRHKRTVSIPDTLQKVKGNGSHFINNEGFLIPKFKFQHGYGIFSVSHDRRETVTRYIANQKEHHRHQNLRTEYTAFLRTHGMPTTDDYQFNQLI